MTKIIRLIIDTSDNKEIKVGLKIDKKEYLEKKSLKSHKTQLILSTIQDLLKKHSLDPKNLSEIQVNRGPGSYTGLRVGVAIANALSFSLGIPINGKKSGEIILPIYKWYN